MPLVPSPQGPGFLPYVFFIAHEFPKLVHVDGSTFLVHWVLVFGFNKQLPSGSISLEMKCVCIPYLLQIFLILSPKPLGVWDDYVS